MADAHAINCVGLQLYLKFEKIYVCYFGQGRVGGVSHLISEALLHKTHFVR